MVKANSESKCALVTGSAGFIGTHLVKALSDRGWTVKEIDRVYGTSQDLSTLAGRRNLERLLYGASLVYHLAGVADWKAHNNPRVALEDLIAGSNVMLGCAWRPTPLVVVSSAYALTRNTAYGIVRGHWEDTSNSFRLLGFPVSTLRLFNVYGPGQEKAKTYTSTVLLNLYHSFRAGRLEVKSTGVRRDFVYIDDVISALVRAGELAIMGSYGEHEAGSGEMCPVPVMAQHIANSLGINDPISYQGKHVEVSPPYTRAANMLLVKPEVSLADGVKRTVDYLLDEEGNRDRAITKVGLTK